MGSFKTRYSTKSIRLKSWNYSSDGYYYVTICTKERKCYFGRMVVDEIIYSDVGRIVCKIWKAFPQHYSCVIIDHHVIMPNRLHGILVIENSYSGSQRISRSNAINSVATTGGITGKYKPMLSESFLVKK